MTENPSSQHARTTSTPQSQQVSQIKSERIAQPSQHSSRHDTTQSKPSSTLTDKHRFPWLLTISLPDLFDWLLKILGVVIAVLFGIWAPLSYNATADGNRENNKAQEQLALQISSVKDAADTKDVEQKLVDLSLLRVWEFCETREDTFDACATVVASASRSVESLISSIAGLKPMSSSSATPTETVPPDGSGPDGSRSRAGKGGTRLGTFTIVTIALVSAFVAVGIAAILYRILSRGRRAKRAQDGDAEDGKATNAGSDARM